MKHLPRRLVGVFFLLDGGSKVFAPDLLRSFAAHLGFEPSVVPLIGALLLASTLLYLIPRTAPLGAVLMTAYFGGALAAHARVNDPTLIHIVILFFAVSTWGALYLIDPRVRALIAAR